MTDQQNLDEIFNWIGPVDYIIVEFPGSKITREGLPLLSSTWLTTSSASSTWCSSQKELDGSGIAVADLDNDGILNLAGGTCSACRRGRHHEAGGVLEPGSSSGLRAEHISSFAGKSGVAEDSSSPVDASIGLAGFSRSTMKTESAAAESNS